ncbi:hypothetical protein E1B28_004360 [Marasmius oreades]|uniref:Yos1-like protein n=1 Tax=Marasmius oreades TaxID=181124 RepID=A0A9P7UYL1_9AGAR|nr:uncharacterized protein E1B28_004360 [Marasmius oreades]KAG7096963.1 hypothetical protein E1B28_004360 [Marasmius oreades]
MLGTIIYVAVLLVNAVAILNEERFLARIGWTTSRPQVANAGFQSYDQTAYSGVQGDVGIKAKGIELVTAVRTLLRIPLIAINIVIIVYELVLGG